MDLDENEGLKRDSAHSELWDARHTSYPAHRQPPTRQVSISPHQREVREKIGFMTLRSSNEESHRITLGLILPPDHEAHPHTKSPHPLFNVSVSAVRLGQQ